MDNNKIKLESLSDLKKNGIIESFAEVFAKKFDLKKDDAKKLIEEVQNLEHMGYQFEAADGSLFILMNKLKNIEPNFFKFEKVERRYMLRTKKWIFHF